MPFPTSYLTPSVPPAPQPASGPDATAEFHQKLNDPNRWIVKSGVPIFKAHERTDPATGQLIKVDLPKLYRIAQNMQRLERDGGVPIRMTLGHTEPGKPETQQPPVGGYYRNARVQPFGPKQEPAVVVDEWLDPQYAPLRKNYPYRSSEYYDDAEQITGVALLTRDPYLDLGVVAYSSDRQPIDYHVDYSQPRPPTLYAWNGRRPTMYHLVLGDAPMWPQTPQNPTGAAPAPYPQPMPQPPVMGYPPVPPPQPPAQHPQPTEYPQTQAPTPYGAPTNYNPALAGMALRAGVGALGSMAGNAFGPRDEETHYGQAHRPPSMRRTHPSGGAIYQNGPRRYAGDEGPGGPPPGAGGPGGGGGGGDPLEQLQMLLMAAVEVLGQLSGGGGGPGGPPSGPMPGEGAPYARTGGGRGGPRRNYSNPGDPVNYGYPYGAPTDEYGRPLTPPAGYPARRPAPTPYGAPPPAQVARTIEGRPVGEALRVSQLQYQLQQQNEAIRMLMYERDAADTTACVTAIQRLADAGYQVGEWEVNELKKRSGDDRQIFLDTIATKYSRIGTTPLPPLLGDPQPQGPQQPQGPATEAEMQAALKLSAADPSIPYTTALNYARSGQLPTGPVNRLANYAGAPLPTGSQAGFDPSNPYGEPSSNGQY